SCATRRSARCRWRTSRASVRTTSRTTRGMSNGSSQPPDTPGAHRPKIGAVGDWFSIEVIDGSFAAGLWAEREGDALIWLAQEHGLSDWTWETHSWGVVLELELPDEATWEAFLAHPAVRGALDRVPNPTTGLLVYRGRGGSA